MDIVEAVNARKSIRAFKLDPVPRAILEKIAESAIRAPSWGNTQPWDIVIAAGEKLEAIRRGFDEKAGQPSGMDVSRPQEFPEPYASRRRSLALRSGEGPAVRPPAGATPTPEVRRPPGPRFFGAPCVIYLCTGRSYYLQNNGINSWAIFDLGLIAENIMLLATGYGLGSIALAAAVTYPDVLRKVLEVPESQLFVVGIAIGYADLANPVNERHSSREPTSNVVKWCGF
ncbi:MAG: nitroreductase [Chloroflexi bacterium]|nr:nitroreductase [Chloroflexota bacterium]